MQGKTSRAGRDSGPASASSAATYRSRLDEVQVLTPTALEYWAVRATFPAANVILSGVSLSRRPETGGEIAITCGLAGGLDAELAPGTVVIPGWVGATDGRSFACDQTLVQALTAGARALGFEPDPRPLLTSPTFVTGSDRDYWSRRGFVAADMETGLLAERNLRVAAVRVVLDSPSHDLTEKWLRPGRAIMEGSGPAARFSAWRELFWLCGTAPRYSLRAARVLHAGLQLLGEVPDA